MFDAFANFDSWMESITENVTPTDYCLEGLTWIADNVIDMAALATFVNQCMGG